jgi:two-component system, cell cycle sensor histidine kinase and response regulator CckA
MEATESDTPKVTLLYVDDESMLREMMVRVISSHYPKYKLLLAGDGLQALDIIDEHQPDIILVDYSMPNLDGYALSERLLSNNSKRNIIVVSGCLNRSLIEKFNQIGVTTFLPKPYTCDDLYSAIDNMASIQD